MINLNIKTQEIIFYFIILVLAETNHFYDLSHTKLHGWLMEDLRQINTWS